ncbi:hypothetical protein AJ79_02061 [Helicocarpus griseus UAMH5409]|uniref:beta-glucosidase n=1 Tax=Helicocarpus griseus UAMH5409 TaxID=1447875 RepID=A0A2B7XVU9_9EURO|nr:hypothetical protein AJ79_02061 [Helicocarpus griseus UAMH5409]
MRSLTTLTTLAATVSTTLCAGVQSNPVYKDPAASVDDRVDDLVSWMTLQEKAAQLVQGDMVNWINTTTNEFNYTGLVENMKTRAGSFYVGHPVPQQWVTEGGRIAQEYLLENTTHGIPAFVQSEGIHGFLIGNATIFNSPIAYACSFNRDLVRKMAAAIAQESLALGVNQIFAPVVDLARELRFGRVEETFGEDGYLAGELGYEYIVGLQSGNVSAMVKHFAGFSMPEQGLNTGPVHGGERELRTTWLPPFHRAIIDADAWSVMGAYHSYDGVAAVADKHLMTEILRKEWGYKYHIISDAGATDRLCKNFKMCREDPIDSEAVTLFSLPAGNDIEMGGGSWNFEVIPKLVESGKLDISVVDTAVARVLRTKFVMGLFENPIPSAPADQIPSLIHTAETVQLARELDAESIVLLENHDNILPLKEHTNVAVIGPMGDFLNFGDYVVKDSAHRPDGVTPLEGIKAASKGKVTYAQGCERWSNDQSGFAEAVSAAEEADVAVVIVGTWSRDQEELWAGVNATTGEHVDVASLNLVGAQGPLVQTIIETGKPTIVVYSSGKPITEPWISNSAAALVQQFYPSEQGGHALADILFGAVNPSAKLSVSFPYDVGTLPIYYDYLNSGRSTQPGKAHPNGTLDFGHQYVLNTPQPLYEFGFGRSYSTFLFSDEVQLSPRNDVTADDTVTATVSVTNESDRDGDEVVQLYVQDVLASVVVPNKQLRGFEKVLVKAGETVEVRIDVRVADLGVWDTNMEYVVEPGEFVFWMGSSSLDLPANATLTVV